MEQTQRVETAIYYNWLKLPTHVSSFSHTVGETHIFLDQNFRLRCSSLHKIHRSRSWDHIEGTGQNTRSNLVYIDCVCSCNHDAQLFQKVCWAAAFVFKKRQDDCRSHNLHIHSGSDRKACLLLNKRSTFSCSSHEDTCIWLFQDQNKKV